MEDILVSICMPSYNSAAFISETLDSIKNQTYQNWELIVADDASEDETKEIVEEFSKEVNQQVLFIRNQKNSGVAVTRNIAVSNSTSEWIAFIDSDDLWKDDHLYSLVNTLKARTDCDVIHSAMNIFDSQTSQTIFRQSFEEETIKQFPLSLFDGSYYIQICSAMISRKLYESIGGLNANFKYAEDLEFWLRAARAGFRFAFTGKVTCNYRRHSGSLSSHALQITMHTARVYDLNSDWEMIPKKTRLNQASSLWLSVARMARSNNMALAKESLNKSMKYNFTFKHLGYWLFLRLPFFNYLKRPITPKLRF